MSVFVKGLRTSAGWIVVAVLAATAAPGRAQIATPTDAARPETAPADDSEPLKVLPRDFSSPPDYRVMADLTGVDVSAGSTAAKTLASPPEAVAETPRTTLASSSPDGRPESARPLPPERRRFVERSAAAFPVARWPVVAPAALRAGVGRAAGDADRAARRRAAG